MALTSTTMRWYPLVHLLAYQVVWFCAVLGGASGTSWPGVLAAAALVVLHLAVQTRRDVIGMRLLAALVIGVVADGALVALGLLSFSHWSSVMPPAWMLVLWPCFASLFDDMLAWLVRRPLVGAVAGALGGPLAYVGGQALGAVAFPAGTLNGLVAVALAWALAVPLLQLVWRWRAGGK